MSEFCVALGQNIFEFNKGPLRAESYVSATFKTIQVGSLHEQPPSAASRGFRDHDHWIPRVLRLEITFKVTFTLHLHLQKSERLQLVETLRRSVLLAELWTQLGLRSSHNGSLLNYDAQTGVFHFAILLLDTRRCPDGNESTRPTLVCQNVSNLKPPTSIPSHQLTSVHVSMTFGPNMDSATAVHIDSGGAGGKKRSLPYIRLLDAVLRSILCHNLTCLPGIKAESSRQSHSLSRIGPSTFLPGYADLLACRANLIEPITKFLFAYKKRIGRTNFQLDNNDTSVRSTQSTEDGRNQVENDLWVTMANALKNEQSTRRLKPLKFSPPDMVDLSDKDFEDIAQSQVDTAMDDLEEMQILEDEVPIDDQLLFEFLDGSEIRDQVVTKQSRHQTHLAVYAHDIICGPASEEPLSDTMLCSEGVDYRLQIRETDDDQLLQSPRTKELCSTYDGSTRPDLPLRESEVKLYLDSGIMELDLPDGQWRSTDNAYQRALNEDILLIALGQTHACERPVELSGAQRGYLPVTGIRYNHDIEIGTDFDELNDQALEDPPRPLDMLV